MAAMATNSFRFHTHDSCLLSSSQKLTQKRPSNLAIQSKATDESQNGGVSRRRIWRRRKLMKKDEMIRYAQERSPFVEEQVRDIWETGKLVGYDIERLKLWEDNIFMFVNNLAAEANELVELNKDEYGGKKKAILHAISNRMNEMGFYRPEAYMRTDPFKHITKLDTSDDDHDT
ncbi:protein PLASTID TRANSCRIPTIONALLY ACTIVE 7-like [Rutidosis leptorrhynchoides]|uniref:protein PLASTID TRANSCRIPTIONALLY ACTIVE 7-like n=1 Tax=Rutidosis leptorrhynchoides TaxID=125765 RepID=UPI003A9A46C0